MKCFLFMHKRVSSILIATRSNSDRWHIRTTHAQCSNGQTEVQLKINIFVIWHFLCKQSAWYRKLFINIDVFLRGIEINLYVSKLGTFISDSISLMNVLFVCENVGILILPLLHVCIFRQHIEVLSHDCPLHNINTFLCKWRIWYTFTLLLMIRNATGLWGIFNTKSVFLLI